MRAVVLVVLAASGAIALAGDVAPDHVQRLIERLGGGGYRDREAATRELDALGEAALEPLRAVAATAEPETRRRAADLVARISERLATARVLAPTPVEFAYSDKPLADAVADLARKTGATITLHDPAPNKFHGRKVTAATPGPVPFWEAVELLCRKADLHEWDGLTPIAGLAAQQPPNQPFGQGGLGGGQVIVLNRSGRSRPTGQAPGTIVLLDGPGQPMPMTAAAGAVRVRVLPPNTPFPNTVLAADEVLLPLHLSPEPKLHWQAAANLRVERVIDETGRQLTATAALPMVEPNDDEVFFINGINGMMMQAQSRRAGPVGVRVRRGDKPARKIAELAGTVAADVRLAEPLVVVDAPLKAAGQGARGAHGVSLTVKSISRGDSGDVTLSADLRVPLDIQLPQMAGVMNLNGGMLAGPIIVQGGGILRIGPGGPGTVAGPPPGATDYQGLSVEDAKGRKFAAAKGVHEFGQFAQDGMTIRVTATFRPAEKSIEPARLVFTATRPAMIDVPFVVKDVPLP